MQTRRAQPAITIRSQRALDRLRVLTRSGRSQAQIVEEALDRMPDEVVEDDRAKRLARLDAIIARTSTRNPPIPSMAEFDAQEYDESGDLR
jgi:hypothetical protein